MSERNIPRLRFPGFEDEWEEKSLGELLLEGKLGGNYENSEADIGIAVIKMGNLGRGSISLNKIQYLPENESYNLEDILQIGDLLFNTRNTLELVGKVAIWNNEIPHAVYNSNIMRLIFNSDVEKSNRFMNFQLNGKKAITQLRSFATGTTSVAAIYGRDLRKLKIAIPNIDEQTKIADFLSISTNKIEQLKKKKNLLENYKNGMIQKIFNQEIRFQDKDGKDFRQWEEKLGGELFENVSNKNHNSDLPILAITQEFGAIPREMIDYNVLVSDKSVDSYKVVDVGDFIISLRSFQGGIEYSNYLGICSPAYIILRLKHNYNKKYFKYYLKTPEYIELLNSNLEGIRDGKMISYKYFSDYAIRFPSSRAEQDKIVDFLSAIDDKINLVAVQIEKMEKFKTGLLNEMFV